MKTTEKKSVTVAENPAKLGGNLRKTDSEVRVIPGNLVLEKDRIFEQPIFVKGNIVGKNGMKYNLTVKGNITARNITARDINAQGDINVFENITAWYIYAWDINAWNITARGNINANNINAWNIHALGDITAWNIHARSHITALNITALDINVFENINAKGDISAGFIICESLKQPEGKRLVCKNLIEKRSTYELKEAKR